MFKSLQGFISVSDDVKKDTSFLAACAEYCPVDEVLADGLETLTECDRVTLEKNKERRILYLNEFDRVLDEMIEAYNSAKTEAMIQVFDKQRRIVEIFGLKPENKLAR